MNKVIARLTDGSMIKGMTADFLPTRDAFHVSEETAPTGAKPVKISMSDLKALFFVTDFAGDTQHVERNEFDSSNPPAGRRIRVMFNDGEVLVGTTTSYQSGRPGFFLLPADASSNIERCYIFVASTQDISFL